MSATAPETLVEDGTGAPDAPTDEGADAGFLRGVEVFGDLVASKRKPIAKRFERRSLEAGETLYAVGDYDGREAIVLLSGALSVQTLDAVRGDVAIGKVAPRTLFGLDYCLADDERAASAVCVVAERASEIAVISSEDLSDLIQTSGDLALLVAQRFATQLLDGAGAAALGPEERVVSALLTLLTADASAPGGWRIDKMPKHRAIAEIAGVDDAAVAGVVARLIQDGLVARDYPGLVVVDYDGLRKRTVSKL